MAASPSFPRLWQTVLDTTDPRGLAEFYRELLGFAYRPGDEPPGPGQDDARGRDWLVIRDRAGSLPGLAFQQTTSLRQTTWPDDEVPQQLHLDLAVPSKAELDVQHARALKLGARLRLDRSQDEEEPVRVYADPAGHLFCLFVTPLADATSGLPQKEDVVPEFPVTVTDDGPMIVATVRLPGITPERALAAFTDPATLARWWSGELATILVPGTPYTISFRQLDRAITGAVVAYQPARHLEFTWVWDHEPVTIRRTVLVAVAPVAPVDPGEPAATTRAAGVAPSGTILSVTHGPHADLGQDPGQAESAARAEHRDGWEFFLPRLAALLSQRPAAEDLGR